MVEHFFRILHTLTPDPQAYSSASASMLSAFQHAAHATVLASRAFFSPGMLQLLYFPH